MATRQRGQVLTNADGSYSIRYYLPSGKRKQEGTFRTVTLAQRRLRDALREIDTGAFRDEITFDALADRWIGVYDASTATRKRVASQVALMRAEFGRSQVRKITPEQVAAWRLTLSDGQRHQTHGVLRQVLEAAIRWGYLASNPARSVPNPQPKRAEVAYLRDWEQVDRIVAELDDASGALVIFAVGTGLRPAEWSAIRASDVDHDRRIVRVERSWTEHDGVKAYGKTDASRRSVPLRQRVLDAIADQPRRGLLFPAERGGHIRLRNWRRREWVPALEAAGLPAFRPYAMRHTFCAWSLAAGIDLFTLARRMGTSVEMIDRTYGHLQHDAASREAELLDDWDAR